MWHSSRSECLSDRICQRVILIRVKIPYFLHVSAALWDESATAGNLCCPVFKACRLSAWICDNVLSRAQRGRVTSAHVPLYWTSTEWSLGSSPSFSQPELMWQDAVELGGRDPGNPENAVSAYFSSSLTQPTSFLFDDLESLGSIPRSGIAEAYRIVKCLNLNCDINTYFPIVLGDPCERVSRAPTQGLWPTAENVGSGRWLEWLRTVLVTHGGINVIQEHQLSSLAFPSVWVSNPDRTCTGRSIGLFSFSLLVSGIVL